MSKHTKTPWKMEWVEPPLVVYPGWWIRTNDSVGFPIAFVTETIGGTNPPQQANARFIVTACNSHDKLLEACKGVAIMLNTVLCNFDDEPWAMRVRSAISLAEGKEDGK